MKWVVLTVGIAIVAITVLGVGMAHYCMPPATHGFTPMICKIPIPPGMPHANYH